MKELFKRVAVAVIAIPLLVFIILEGSWYFFTLIAIIAIGGQLELYNISRAKGGIPQTFSGLLITIALLFIIQLGPGNYLLIIVISGLLFLTVFEMFNNKGSAILNTAITLLGILYPGIFLAMLLYLRSNAQNMGISSAGGFILTLFVSIWACDSFAYFIGVAIGKHRLFERVSPKKSIEGAVAGICGSFLVFLTVYYFKWYDIPLAIAVWTALCTGVIGQAGDLVESWFKRDAQVKDSSHILPGHGGLLDRFDSLILISPFLMIIYLFYTG